MDYKLPELGEGIDSATVVKVLIQPGDTVNIDQAILEIETNKAVIELPSEASGTVDELQVSDGDEIKTGQVLFTYSSEKETSDEAEAEAEKETSEKEDTEAKESASAPAEDKEKEQSDPKEMPEDEKESVHSSLPTRKSKPSSVPASPSVRRKARLMGIDLSEVAGSGPGGRVSAADLVKPAGSQPSSVKLPDFSKYGETRVEKMSNVRYSTAKQVALCWEQIPRVTHHDKADITELEALRQKYKSKAADMGGKLTMAVMVVKVVTHALKKFPQFNASIDMAEKKIIFKDYINVGIAIATDRGLLVPGIKDADTKNMIEIAAEITEMAKRARAGKMNIKEMQGNTFTVTNIGRIGGSYFTPIVNFPEVAILGMGRTFTEPAFVEGELKERTMLPLSLSYDHRLIDGADAAEFLGWIVDAIQEPLILSLEG